MTQLSWPAIRAIVINSLTLVTNSRTLVTTSLILGSSAVAAECPYAPPTEASSEIPTSCEVEDVESLLANGQLQRCETLCLQTIASKNQLGRVGSVQIVATNNLTVPANLELALSLTNVTPTPDDNVEATLPPGSTYYVYQGNALDSSRSAQYELDYRFYPGVAGAFHDDSFVYELPWQNGRKHLALNGDDDFFQFALPVATSVVTARAGTVVGVKDQKDIRSFNAGFDHAANEILIQHSDQTIGVYRNIAQNGALVALGDTVEQAQVIAVSGQTGAAVNPMLTFYVTSPSEASDDGFININFLAEEGIFNYFSPFEGYTAVHENQLIDPDLSFEDDVDPELDSDGSVPNDPGDTGNPTGPSSASVAAVQQAYISYYGRPGDPAGVEYWATELDNSGGDLSAIIDAFGNSPEYRSRFGSYTTPELINNLYQQMFGRNAESAGLEWWSEQIDSGATTLSQAAIQIASGAQDEDFLTLSNRTAVAQSITSELNALGGSYGSDEIELAKSFIQDVDASTDTSTIGIEAFVLALIAD